MRTFLAIVEPGLLQNARMIEEGLYAMGWPLDPKAYPFMRDVLGVKTRINFRTSESDEAQCRAAGIDYIAYPMTVLTPVSIEKMREIITLTQDPALRPIVGGCASGQDRTGYWQYCYRVWVCGWSKDEALDEMRRNINNGVNFEIWHPIREKIEEA